MQLVCLKYRKGTFHRYDVSSNGNAGSFSNITVHYSAIEKLRLHRYDAISPTEMLLAFQALQVLEKLFTKIKLQYGKVIRNFNEYKFLQRGTGKLFEILKSL